MTSLVLATRRVCRVSSFSQGRSNSFSFPESWYKSINGIGDYVKFGWMAENCLRNSRISEPGMDTQLAAGRETPSLSIRLVTMIEDGSTCMVIHAAMR